MKSVGNKKNCARVCLAKNGLRRVEDHHHRLLVVKNWPNTNCGGVTMRGWQWIRNEREEITRSVESWISECCVFKCLQVIYLKKLLNNRQDAEDILDQESIAPATVAAAGVAELVVAQGRRSSRWIKHIVVGWARRVQLRLIASLQSSSVSSSFAPPWPVQRRRTCWRWQRSVDRIFLI